MSSVIDPHPESSDYNELVAYLDGELGPEECLAIEERLASDDEYRQQLRELDQAWEALGALPSTAVDDTFARTTIELACVAAEEDLSRQTKQTSIQSRKRWQWWIAGGLAAAAIGFLTMRALEVHRTNKLLADLPVIQQFDVLSLVPNVEFLEHLSKSQLSNELAAATDETVLRRAVSDFKNTSSASVGDRRRWIDSLTPEQKAELADRARAFAELEDNAKEKDRVRFLANEISRHPDAHTLQATLVAYGAWLAKRTAGEQQQLREDFQKLSTAQQVDEVRELLEDERREASRRLSDEEREAMRREILAIARDRRAKLIELLPKENVEQNQVPEIEPTSVGPARFFLGTALGDTRSREETQNRLLSKLSADSRRHWDSLPTWPRDQRRGQLWQWINDAIQPKWGPEDLERFFLSEHFTKDERQWLLNLPRAEMNAELEKRYLQSTLSADDRWRALRNLGDVWNSGRGGPRRDGPQDRGPPPFGLGPPPDGPPPPREGFGPDGPPREPYERERPRRFDGAPRPPDPDARRNDNRVDQRPRRAQPGDRSPGDQPRGEDQRAFPPPGPPDGRPGE